MKPIQLILIDLVLMLLAPEIAEAMNKGVGANFTLAATKAVPPFKRIAGAEAVLSSGENRHQTTQAVPCQLSADALSPAKLAENSATLKPALSTSSTSARGSVRLPALKMPAAVTPSIRIPAAAPEGLLGAETPRWSETDRIVGGMVIVAFAAILLVSLMERCSTGTGT
ncbi:hypothetical protein AAFG07_33905 [Bradyrhizobium sp. B097]|uniref:hypothetical protein n=1 Tax=Bradyrhizobium sp. B097 TaxID=3140244 RepID=UPI003183BD2E